MRRLILGLMVAFALLWEGAALSAKEELTVECRNAFSYITKYEYVDGKAKEVSSVGANGDYLIFLNESNVDVWIKNGDRLRKDREFADCNVQKNKIQCMKSARGSMSKTEPFDTSWILEIDRIEGTVMLVDSLWEFDAGLTVRRLKGDCRKSNMRKPVPSTTPRF